MILHLPTQDRIIVSTTQAGTVLLVTELYLNVVFRVAAVEVRWSMRHQRLWQSVASEDLFLCLALFGVVGFFSVLSRYSIN